jgi:hypothetical protein
VLSGGWLRTEGTGLALYEMIPGSSSHFGTQAETNRYAKMYRSDNLEFVVSQSIWMEGEAKFADIILPNSGRYTIRITCDGHEPKLMDADVEKSIYLGTMWL